MCSKFVANESVAWRRPCERRDELLGERRGGLHRLALGDEVRERLAVRPVATCPAPGRGERDDRAGAPARGELECDVAAERVARDVRRREARIVHRALDRVGERPAVEGGRERRPPGVAGQRRGEHVVPPLEVPQDELPGAPGVREAVDAHERRAGAAAMGRREARVHARSDPEREAVLARLAAADQHVVAHEHRLAAAERRRRGIAEDAVAAPRERGGEAVEAAPRGRAPSSLALRGRAASAARRAQPAGRARGRRGARRPAGGPAAACARPSRRRDRAARRRAATCRG